MKILVALKQVPARDSVLRAGPISTSIDESGLSFEVNEPDAYALEAALQLRDRVQGEVVLLSAGPARVSSAIGEALAKGADRALHVLLDNPEAYDSLSLARLLAAAARTEAPDLILAGIQAEDTGAGQTGVILAELLNFAHATLIMAVEPSPSGLRVKRELEAGFFQSLDLPLPAVLTIQSGFAKLRYATLMGIKRAKTKQVRTLTPSELGVQPAPGVRALSLAAPRRDKQTQFLSGSPGEQAAALIDKLRHEARVL